MQRSNWAIGSGILPAWRTRRGGQPRSGNSFAHPGRVANFAELTIRIGREQGSNMFFMCPLLLGWTIFESGETIRGPAAAWEMRSARTRHSARRFYYDYELLVFAEALLKAGELDQAQQVLQETLDRIISSGNCLFEAEATSPVGHVLRNRGGDQIAEAEALLLKALETSEQQGALSFKLRAATNLGDFGEIITATVTRTMFSRPSTNGSPKVSILPT